MNMVAGTDRTIAWDGVHRSYIPSADLQIDPSLTLHRQGDAKVDPITYEVVRNSLVSANFEHGALLQQLCVSPVVLFAADFQTALLAENGDLICMGPNLQYFANSSSLVVKWILENRSSNPGIRPGDMWFSNDAYVGCPHQPDACVAAPIFVGDQVFGWVTNIVHYIDVGGPVPSQNIDARNIWDEAPMFPPIRIVEDRKAREDALDVFIRQSRQPLVVGTDLRAAIASCEATRRKIESLIERYGADVTKAVMNGMLDTAQTLFRERLATIPDGRWSHRIYTEAARKDDQNVHRVTLTIIKSGDRITIDNDGTDPQAGAISLTFGPFSGAIFTALTMMFTPELSGAVGGVYRQVDFDLKPGTLVSPDFPAAMSPTGSVQAAMSIYAALIATSKMISCSSDPDLRAQAIGPSIPHFYANSVGISGPTGHWHVMGADGMIGAIGGMAARDGVDAGGHIWIPESMAPNVEHYERIYPAVFLFRRLLPANGDGAGRHRGGRGIELGVMIHGEDLKARCETGGNESFVKSQGQWGGSPGSRANYRVQQNANTYAAMAEGRVPQSLDDEASPIIRYKDPNSPWMRSGDLYSWTSPTTAGWGDPLLRDMEAVASDAQSGGCDAASAAAVYGVVLKDGVPDRAATGHRRAQMREDRIGRALTATPGEGAFPADALRWGDSLVLAGGHWHCDCGTPLAPSADNYKTGTYKRVIEIADLGEGHSGGAPDMAAKMEYRSFCCPGCGTVIDTEIAERSDPCLHDVAVAG